MTRYAPIETARRGVPAWAIWLTVLLFLVGGVYFLSNLAGENPPLAIPGGSGPPHASGPPGAAVGEALTQEASPQCQACHGQRWEGAVGPPLTGVAEGAVSDNLQDFAAEHPDDWAVLWIDGTVPEVEGLDRGGMPLYGEQFSPEQIEAIVAFLKSL